MSTKPAERWMAIDVLRGLVMVLMAIDHVRDFFSNVHFDPTDLARTTPALFVTRVITHYCAPVFCFLAGTGAYLSSKRGKSKRELSSFLVTRGLWLVVLELTLVRFGWTFDPAYHFTPLQVIWALGWSMVVLALLVHLPVPLIGLTGIVIIAGHNALDGFHAGGAWWWRVLHESFSRFEVAPGHVVQVIYPLVPWIGVMAVGYAAGALLETTPEARRTRLFALGAGLTLAFVQLRAAGTYGDARAWSVEPRPLFTVFSFVSTTKYPPSLLYLLMTLGPALFLLGAFERARGPIAERLAIFGRVPMFFYLLHLPLIHGLSKIAAVARYGTRALSFGPDNVPADLGYDLPVVYAVWAAVVLMLYPACRWFADLKRRRRDLSWLGYF
ncbi:MAG: heparan-alpha-glucosaminide N-acetyltransferase domain-containing protein [Byssovorax sp.]